MVGEFGDRYEIIIPDELRSRGTREQVPLSELVPFDQMPQLIGNAFFTDEHLNAGVHFYGGHGGPFMAAEDAYMTLAEEASSRGELRPALDLYRRGVHYALQWSKAVSLMQKGALFAATESELDRFDPEPRFRNLEERLMAMIWQGDVAFDPQAYDNFVREVRAREKRACQLGQLFAFGESNAFEPLTAPGIHDPKIGREYIDLSVKMGRFSTAADVAKELGLDDEARKYEERAGSEPNDDPRIRVMLDDWEYRREFGGRG